MNFLGRVKLGTVGAEVGSLKANNEKIAKISIKCGLQILFVTCHTASGPNVKMRPLCHRSHPWSNQLKWYST